jgi:hypothetical protein
VQHSPSLYFALPHDHALVDLVDLAVGVAHGLVQLLALLSDPLADATLRPARGASTLAFASAACGLAATGSLLAAASVL